MTSTKIIDFLVEEFKRDNGIDLSSDKMAMQRLKDAAEKTKKDLSGVSQTSNQPTIHFCWCRWPITLRSNINSC